MSDNGESIIPCLNLDETIEKQIQLGYRLDMIFPADSPTVAIMSKGGKRMRIEMEARDRNPSDTACGSDWVTGRAGMEYRDLIPDRLGGRLIASHIRLKKGGEVPDYVHYHKVAFQMIYCKQGRIRVVYEDQGPPFWLETGDCVLQPPEIRHRVLECTAGAEVVEIGMPAVHETWVEHEINLPTGHVLPERNFGGQRFVRHVAADSSPVITQQIETCDTGITCGTGGLADVLVLSINSGQIFESIFDGKHQLALLFVLTGNVTISDEEAGDQTHLSGQLAVVSGAKFTLYADEPSDVLYVKI